MPHEEAPVQVGIQVDDQSVEGVLHVLHEESVQVETLGRILVTAALVAVFVLLALLLGNGGGLLHGVGLSHSVY